MLVIRGLIFGGAYIRDFAVYILDFSLTFDQKYPKILSVTPKLRVNAFLLK